MDSIRIVFLLLLTVVTTCARAGGIDALYSSEQVVAQQQGEPSLRQVRQGLSDVLVKVAGSADVLSRPPVLAQLDNARSLLRRFGYSVAPGAVEQSGQAQRAYALTLDFDQAGVDQLLERAGERPLGSFRPTLMVWLAAQQQGGRDYVSPDGYIYQQVEREAARRGLPLRTPLLDLQDQQRLPVSDLWGLFSQSIVEASSRYKADAILAGRLIQTTSGGWHYEWTLIQSGKEQRFSASGSLESQIPEVINNAADTLFASLRGSGFSYQLEGLALSVSNVTSLTDYLSLVDYLKTLPTVTSVQTIAAEGSHVQLMITLDGNLEQLEQALRLQPNLIPAEIVGEQEGGLTLNYRWQR